MEGRANARTRSTAGGFGDLPRILVWKPIRYVRTVVDGGTTGVPKVLAGGFRKNPVIPPACEHCMAKRVAPAHTYMRG